VTHIHSYYVQGHMKYFMLSVISIFQGPIIFNPLKHSGYYSWTREPNRLHHASCGQPCGLKALGLQQGIPYEISRDHHS
jgi:hypothetical protein